MYIIIGFAFFSFCSCIGNRLPHVLLIPQRLASCLYRSKHPAVPIHTSKLSAYLLETKHTEHIKAASHFHIFKSVSLLFLSFASSEIGFICTPKDHRFNMLHTSGRVYHIIVAPNVECSVKLNKILIAKQQKRQRCVYYYLTSHTIF